MDRVAKQVFSIDPQELYSRATLDGGCWDGTKDSWSKMKLGGGFYPPEQPVLSNPPMTSSSPRLFLGSNLLLSLAPPETKEGDVICQFWETDVVALLRKEIGTGVYRIVGRLHLSTGYLKSLKPIYLRWIEPVQRADTVRIEMDIRTLSRFTA
jgi:hypothetical protein